MKGKRIIDPATVIQNPKHFKLTPATEINKRFEKYCGGPLTVSQVCKKSALYYGEPVNALEFPFISSQSLPKIRKVYKKLIYEPVCDNTGKPKYHQDDSAYVPKLGKTFHKISVFCPAKPFLEFSFKRYYENQKGIHPRYYRYGSAKKPFRKYQVFCPSKPFLGDQFRRYYENEDEKVQYDEEKINKIDLMK